MQGRANAQLTGHLSYKNKACAKEAWDSPECGAMSAMSFAAGSREVRGSPPKRAMGTMRATDTLADPRKPNMRKRKRKQVKAQRTHDEARKEFEDEAHGEYPAAMSRENGGNLEHRSDEQCAQRPRPRNWRWISDRRGQTIASQHITSPAI